MCHNYLDEVPDEVAAAILTKQKPLIRRIELWCEDFSNPIYDEGIANPTRFEEDAYNIFQEILAYKSQFAKKSKSPKMK